MNKWFSGLLIAGSAFFAVVLVVVLLRDDNPTDCSMAPQSSAPTMLEDVSKGTNEIQKVENPDKKPVKLVTIRPKQPELNSGEQTLTEQEIMDAIQEALDNEDLKKVASFLKDAAATKNVEVRAKAVEALRWFGVKALPELTMFMADADDDVRTDAIDAYAMGLSEMDAGRAKAEAVRMALSVVTDKDQLESLVMQVDDLTDAQKIDVLVTTIDGKNKKAVEVAREHYEFVTDEAYSNRETAQKWLEAQSADAE